MKTTDSRRDRRAANDEMEPANKPTKPKLSTGQLGPDDVGCIVLFVLPLLWWLI